MSGGPHACQCWPPPGDSHQAANMMAEGGHGEPCSAAGGGQLRAWGLCEDSQCPPCKFRSYSGSSGTSDSGVQALPLSRAAPARGMGNHRASGLRGLVRGRRERGLLQRDSCPGPQRSPPPSPQAAHSLPQLPLQHLLPRAPVSPFVWGTLSLGQ